MPFSFSFLSFFGTNDDDVEKKSRLSGDSETPPKERRQARRAGRDGRERGRVLRDARCESRLGPPKPVNSTVSVLDPANI